MISSPETRPASRPTPVICSPQQNKPFFLSRTTFSALLSSTMLLSVLLATSITAVRRADVGAEDDDVSTKAVAPPLLERGQTLLHDEARRTMLIRPGTADAASEKDGGEGEGGGEDESTGSSKLPPQTRTTNPPSTEEQTNSHHKRLPDGLKPIVSLYAEATPPEKMMERCWERRGFRSVRMNPLSLIPTLVNEKRTKNNCRTLGEERKKKEKEKEEARSKAFLAPLMMGRGARRNRRSRQEQRRRQSQQDEQELKNAEEMLEQVYCPPIQSTGDNADALQADAESGAAPGAEQDSAAENGSDDLVGDDETADLFEMRSKKEILEKEQLLEEEHAVHEQLRILYRERNNWRAAQEGFSSAKGIKHAMKNKGKRSLDPRVSRALYVQRSRRILRELELDHPGVLDRMQQRARENVRNDVGI